MYKVIAILILYLVIYLGYGAENEKTWLSFNEFVDANISKKAGQGSLLMLLNNPNPKEVEFGVRFSITRYKTLNPTPVYEAIWEGNRKAFPYLNMNYLRQPIILLAVTGALSKLKQLKNDEQYEYVLSQINENDPRVLPFAILALGYVGNKHDLKNLTKLGKQEDGKYLFQASFSILEIDYKAGVAILRELQNGFGQDSSQAQLIDRMLKNHKPNEARNMDGCAAGSL